MNYWGGDDFLTFLFHQLCTVITPDRMLCPSPSLVGSPLNVTSFSSTALSYGLSMDGVPTTRNLSRPVSGDHMFVVFPDPQFDEFEDGVKKFFFLPNEYLTINVSETARMFE